MQTVVPAKNTARPAVFTAVAIDISTDDRNEILAAALRALDACYEAR